MTQTQTNNTSDKMRSMPIGKLMISMSLPAIVSMFVQALYNVVDSFFVAKISLTDSFAFDAVSIVTPLCMIATSVGIGIGVGANIFISRKLGEHNHESANNSAKTAFLMCFVFWVIFIALGLTIVRPYMELFTDNQIIIDYGVDYGSTFLIFSLGMMLELVGIRILQATGNMKKPMISQLAGAVTNIILDPIFIFGYCGMPAMGVKGAAIATVAGQWVAAAILLVMLFNKKCEVNLHLKGYRFRWEYVAQIAKIGLPNFIMNSALSFTNMAMISIVNKYPGGVFSLNSQFKLQSFIYMPIFGMCQGATPILSYNYGANNKQRYIKAVKFFGIIALSYMTLGLIIFQSLPQYLAMTFSPTPEELALTIKVFRIMSLSFIFSAVGITMVNVLQSLNLAVFSMVSSLLRQIGFILVFALVYEWLFGIEGVYFCYPTSEILTLVIFVPITIKQFHKQFARKQHQYDTGELKNLDECEGQV